MTRSLALLLVGLIGVGCGVSDPGTLSGGAGSAASGRGGAAGTGVGASTGTGGFIDQGCGRFDYTLEPLRPEILILLDASGSMNDDVSSSVCSGGCGASSKWAATVPAINATVARTEATVNWGLKFFPDSDATCGVAAQNVTVPPGPGNAAAIEMALAGHTSANGGISNGGRTPTRSAENAAIAYLSTRTTMNPRFILLATDGLPNCAPGATDTAADDTAGTVQSIANANMTGYPTFVVGVGIGDSAAGATLSQMAQAGGYPRAGSPSYYPVASTAELAAVMSSLVTVAGACIFATPAPPTNDGTTSRTHIDVSVNGTGIARDTSHTSGWDFTDDSMAALQLFGPHCAAIVAGQVGTVSIVFKCPGP